MAIGYKISQLNPLDETLSPSDLLEIENISKGTGLKSQKITVSQLQGASVTVTRDTGAALELSVPGKYIHVGTGSTWTFIAGSAALTADFILSNDSTSTGNISVRDVSNVVITTIFPGGTKTVYWDDNSKFIVR